MFTPPIAPAGASPARRGSRRPPHHHARQAQGGRREGHPPGHFLPVGGIGRGYARSKPAQVTRAFPLPSSSRPPPLPPGHRVVVARTHGGCSVPPLPYPLPLALPLPLPSHPDSRVRMVSWKCVSSFPLPGFLLRRFRFSAFQNAAPLFGTAGGPRVELPRTGRGSGKNEGGVAAGLHSSSFTFLSPYPSRPRTSG